MKYSQIKQYLAEDWESTKQRNPNLEKVANLTSNFYQNHPVNFRNVFKKVCFSLVTTAIASTFLYAAAEGRLRLKSSNLNDTETSFANNSVGILDDYMGWVPRKGVINKFNHILNTDSNGNRISLESKILDAPTIVGFGDSYMYGGEVSDEETLPFFLSKESSLNVINKGVCAYGFDQIYLYAKKFIQDKESPSDLILVSLITNDLIRNGMKTFEGNYKPYFTINKGQLIYHPPKFFSTFYKLDREMKSHSLFWKQLSLLRGLDGSVFKQGEKADNNVEEISLLLIDAFKKLREESNIPFFFVIQPYYFKGFRDAKSFVNFPDDIRLASLIEKKLLSDELPVLNLVDDSQEFADPSFWLKYHMTAKGNELVAEKIWDYLKDSPVFDLMQESYKKRMNVKN